MQITVIIPDEFASQMRTRGLTPECYIERLIAEQITALQTSDSGHELSSEEFNTSLDALTRYSDKIPSLSIQSFSREGFYKDRD